jgi:branched-chain amino acid transport system permease protein
MAPFVANGIIYGSLVGLLGLGYAISFWPSRHFHFAFSSVLLAAIYGLWYTSDTLGWPAPVAALVSVTAAMVVGVGVYRLVYRPLRDGGGVLLSALAFTIVFQNLLVLTLGSAIHRIPQAPITNEAIELPLDIHISVVQVAGVITSVVLAAMVIVFLWRARFGVAIRALSSDAFLAETVGIDADRLTTYVYALGSAIAAVAVMFLAMDGGVNPDAGTTPLFYALNGVIMGGARNFVGAFGGGVLLGLVMNVGIWQLPSAYQTTIGFGLLMLVAVFRPNGIFTRRA